MKQLLDNALSECKLDESNPDPLLIARDLPDDAALICALFAYGNVKAIVKFLRSLDFALLDADTATIKRKLSNSRYRFQSTSDIQQLFIGFASLRANNIQLKNIFETAYTQEGFLYALSTLISVIKNSVSAQSAGLNFLLSKPFDHRNLTSVSALKRYLMFIRWMVRKDFPDLGRWRGVNPADLLVPLDTHSFSQAKRIGLITRSRADLLAAVELTRNLAVFDPLDPVKYDFALYRMGQNAKK